MCSVTVGWLTPSSAAARLIERWRETYRKLRRWASLGAGVLFMA